MAARITRPTHRTATTAATPTTTATTTTTTTKVAPTAVTPTETGTPNGAATPDATVARDAALARDAAITRDRAATQGEVGTPVETLAANVTIESHLTRADRHAALAADVREGMTATPKQLPPKWFYDSTGSMLFEKITRLAEYYPTRCESAILHAHAAEIAASTGAETLVELGSGMSEKTRMLLDALAEAGTLRRFVPFDVDDTVLARAAKAIGADYPAAHVHAVVGDFERHLELLPAGEGGSRLVAFLGGTIGNLEPAARHAFLTAVHAQLEPGDAFLLGTDLVKDANRLVAAYNDGAGITAAFNRNVLAVVNRELGADFTLRGFAHLAIWDAEAEWIEMRLRSVRDQAAYITDLDLDVSFADGEQMRTEISAKFRRDGLEAELGAAGLTLAHYWTDPDGDFAVSLSVPTPTTPPAGADPPA